MLGPSRPLPRVGMRARIKHFGGDSEDGTVVAVEDEGRRVRVRTLAGAPHDGGSPMAEDPAWRGFPHGGGQADRQAGGSNGELYEFVLSPSSARFLTVGDAHGPRLELLG